MTTMFRPPLFAIFCLATAAVAAAQPPMDSSPAEMFKRADADGNGKVSRDEFIKSRTAILEERFKQLDTDGNGHLDEKELEMGTTQMRSMLGGGRGGFRRPDGGQPQRPDGERSRRPVGEGSDGERPRRLGAGGLGEQGFDRLDGDGDGKLSREEFAEGMARMREFMGQRGTGPGGPGALGRPDRGGAQADGGFRRPPRQD